MARIPLAPGLSLSDLERMIQDGRDALRKLERRRARYQRKLDAVERRIAAVGGKGRTRGGLRRARNDVSLPETISAVLSQATSPLRVAEIAEKVLATGYRSGSANFRGMVNQALVKDRRFVSETRGVYRMRAPANSRANESRRPRQKNSGNNGRATEERSSDVLV